MALDIYTIFPFGFFFVGVFFFAPLSPSDQPFVGPKPITIMHCSLWKLTLRGHAPSGAYTSTQRGQRSDTAGGERMSPRAPRPACPRPLRWYVTVWRSFYSNPVITLSECLTDFVGTRTDAQQRTLDGHDVEMVIDSIYRASGRV